MDITSCQECTHAEPPGASHSSKIYDVHFISGVVEGFYGRPWTADQRRHLFKQLKNLGMNTYLYAPKDDLKHRAEWRILYTAEEAAVLESLISSANENGISFIYALSPGIDICYSSQKEVKAIKDKISQVRSLGCHAFSLLFDDIEPTMAEQDKKRFSSFVQAQISVSNTIYEFLGCPKVFLFCPTEYCESRANPTLEKSDYLNTLGLRLNPNISVLWTGPRVVSREITVDHCKRVSTILKRKPLIWDNLHANDYDPKRIFLGPFSGRSVKLRQEISGLLLNPNTRYEANFIPIFTLSDWNLSENDAPKVENDQNAILETTPEAAASRVVEKKKSQKLYHPLTSLKRALDEWLCHFTESPGTTAPPMSMVETKTIIPLIGESTVQRTEIPIPPPGTIRTCEGNEMLPDMPLTLSPIYTTASSIGSATTITVQSIPIMETIIGVVDMHEKNPNAISQTLNSLTADYNSMDVIDSDSLKLDSERISLQMDTSINEDTMVNGNDENGNDVLMSEESAKIWPQNLDTECVALFVDMFYLPFESGRRGIELLKEFCWLYENAHFIRDRSDSEKHNHSESQSDEWVRRYDDFQTRTVQLNDLYKFFTRDSPNKEIFPYIYEAQAMISIISGLLQWMNRGNLLLAPTRFSSETDDSSEETDSFDLEPWALGGGLLPDLQRRIVTSSNIADLFTIKSPIPLAIHHFCVRPIDSSYFDEKTNKFFLFETFATSSEKEQISSILDSSDDDKSLNCGDLFSAKTFLPFLTFGNPPHHFLVENIDEDNLVEESSFALGILNASEIVGEYRAAFIEQLKDRYSDLLGTRSRDEKKELLSEFLMTSPLSVIPDYILDRYPSVVELRSKNYVSDAISLRRVLHCIASSLALNGSSGFAMVIESKHDEKIDLLSRLGLETLLKINRSTIMGHFL